MRYIALFSILLLATSVHAAGDAAAGQTKSVVCAACHGADGNSPTNPLWPKLAGQHPGYIVKQLQALKAGTARTDPTMAPMAAPLSDQDMADLAAYFASQTTKIDEADPAEVAAGAKVFRAGDKDNGLPACMGCHGPAGMGNGPANFPRLSGQHADYTVKQLMAFRSGARKNDQNGMMGDVAKKMSDDQMKAVAQFIAGLH
jgi:cytochrome c553